MKIEESIGNCEINLNRIKQYDPDPYYVNYFFSEFINSVQAVFDGIFEEADRDFGLFVKNKISQKSFEEKARKKNDEKAIEFSKWYVEKFQQEHENLLPNFIKKIFYQKLQSDKFPEIKIMIRASDRYQNDIFQQIYVTLSNEKLRSKEELEIEIKRQLPIFLKVINHKRIEKNEPKVKESQVVASTFMDVDEHTDVEIAYAAEIYIPVLRRIVEDSREKISELTRWN